MPLDLEKQLTFYGAYHRNPVNVFIHIICVPLILFSGFELVSNSGPLFSPPTWFLQIPYLRTLQPTAGLFAALTWGGLYVLLEPVAGTLLGLICVAAAGFTNQLRLQDPSGTNKAAIVVHVVCWLLQFLGHGTFEGRAPALLDSLFQAIFLAPLFVWLELLFMLGYRPSLKARVDKAVEVEIAKYRARKAEKKAGKAEKAL